MEDRGAASHSEIPSAETVEGDGESQESSNPSYFDQHGNPIDENGYFVRNNRSDDRSSGSDKVIKVWSEKAADWRSVYAKYIEEQMEWGTPGYGEERAWTSYKKFGWYHHEEQYEIDDPDGTSGSYTWANHSKTSNDKQKR